MDLTERLRAWGAAHAQARSAESAAREGCDGAASTSLRSEARALRDRADRLHREIYRSLGKRPPAGQR